MAEIQIPYDLSRMYLRAPLKAESTEGQEGSRPRSQSARWAHPNPLNTTALTP